LGQYQFSGGTEAFCTVVKYKFLVRFVIGIIIIDVIKRRRQELFSERGMYEACERRDMPTQFYLQNMKGKTQLEEAGLDIKRVLTL
jgi:hypothetical protein